MRVLPDTSVWVEFLRAGRDGPAAALDRLLEEGELVICGPILAELLAGTPPERQEEVWITLTALPWLELDSFGWREVGIVAATLRRTGRSLPLTDVVIAVLALRERAALWTRDRDFARIAEIAPALTLYEAG